VTVPDETELLESIDHRLKMLLRLQVEDKLEDMDTNKEQVRVLHEMGFSNQEMAEMIGTSAGSVRASLSSLREDGEIDD
jgi:DNA-directed RNA polymerase specialized sigma24 family protein